MLKVNKYKRGIAMEMAIGMMLFAVAFSILLYTVGMLQIKNMKSDIDDLQQKIIDYQAEELTNGSSITITIDGKKYTITKDGDGNINYTLVPNTQE